MNKMYTILRYSLPSIYKSEINTKNINPYAANLKQCNASIFS